MPFAFVERKLDLHDHKGPLQRRPCMPPLQLGAGLAYSAQPEDSIGITGQTAPTKEHNPLKLALLEKWATGMEVRAPVPPHTLSLALGTLR